MYMVYTCLCLYYFYSFLLAEFSQYFSYILLQLTVYFFPPILRCKYYMILASIFSMCRIFYFVCTFLTLLKTSMIFFSNAAAKPFTIISWRFFSCESFFSTPKSSNKNAPASVASYRLSRGSAMVAFAFGVHLLYFISCCLFTFFLCCRCLSGIWHILIFYKKTPVP